MTQITIQFSKRSPHSTDRRYYTSTCPEYLCRALERPLEPRDMASPTEPDSAPSTPLLDCPNEIFDGVLPLLGPREFYSLCLVCTKLRTRAEPSLYSRIEWIWVKDRTPPITLILRSIISLPQLANHIQYLALGPERDTFRRGMYAGRAPKINVTVQDLDSTSWTR